MYVNMYIYIYMYIYIAVMVAHLAFFFSAHQIDDVFDVLAAFWSETGSETENDAGLPS